MENLITSPLSLLAQSLGETHGITLENVSTDLRPNWWAGRLHGYKLELEQQKRGQLRVILYISGGKQQTLKESEVFSSVNVEWKPWGAIVLVDSVDEMPDVVEAFEEALLDVGLSKTEKIEVRGPNFQGTVFERITERGATMSGKFGAMVCAASGMNLTETIAEWNLDSGRQADGVELDPFTQKPITLYECQSGIHHGFFLDAIHRDKALGEYLYDMSIIPTVRKVVILAGGYSEEDFRIVRERASELDSRVQPIEVVLLQTVRMEDTIKVVSVSY